MSLTVRDSILMACTDGGHFKHSMQHYDICFSVLENHAKVRHTKLISEMECITLTNVMEQN